MCVCACVCMCVCVREREYLGHSSPACLSSPWRDLQGVWCPDGVCPRVHFVVLGHANLRGGSVFQTPGMLFEWRKHLGAEKEREGTLAIAPPLAASDRGGPCTESGAPIACAHGSTSCVCVCVCVRERVCCVCLCVCVREREGMCLYVPWPSPPRWPQQCVAGRTRSLGPRGRVPTGPLRRSRSHQSRGGFGFPNPRDASRMEKTSWSRKGERGDLGHRPPARSL